MTLIGHKRKYLPGGGFCQKDLPPIKTDLWVNKSFRAKGLFPHQIEAVTFALNRNRSYLALDPGLGKTAVAAVVAKTLGLPVVYVCPPFLVENIHAEFERWAPKLRRHTLGVNFDLSGPIDLLIVPDTHLVKEHLYDQIVTRFSFSRGEINEALLIVDEAHRMKNLDAKRTRGLFGSKNMRSISDLFERQIYLSGTPMPNRPMELYSVFSRVCPELIDHMNFHQFGLKYCGGFLSKWGWDYGRASNLKDLADRVIHPNGPFMLRMKKELLKLPPQIHGLFYLSGVMSSELRGLEKKILGNNLSIEEIIKNSLARKNKAEDKDLSLATYRRLVGVEKVKAASEYIKSLLDETRESILVFAYHKEVVARLESELKSFRPLVITGDTKVSERQSLVNLFQKNNDRRLMIGNYAAMGVGFTLTKATRAVFVEFDWVPGVNQQAADRIHRIGQTSTVFVQYLVFKNSIDESVLKALDAKSRYLTHI